MNAVSRRAALASFAALALVACGGAQSPPPADQGPPLKLEPALDLVVGAGLAWLVTLEPKTIAAAPETSLAIGELFTSERFEAFAARRGVDVRSLDELVIAGYPSSRLAIARGFLDPARVERAFAARVIVDERKFEPGGVVAIEGRVGTDPERIVIFGPRAAAEEHGKPGPLRAARLFAEGRLRRAKPALASEPLATTARALGGPFPARAFFPGPFDDEWSRAGGGLLRIATSVGIGARPVAGPEPGGRLELVMVVLGHFEDVEGAKARLGATLDRLFTSDVGRLVGAHEPAEPLRVDPTPDGLRARIVLRALPLFRGLYDATDASAVEIVR